MVVTLSNEEDVALDVGRIIANKYRKIYGFIIVARNIPGSFYSILETFAKNRLNIVYFSTSEPTLKEYGNFLLYVDFTDSKVKPETIVEELSKNVNVRSIRIIRPVIEGVMVDTLHFPLIINEERAIIFRKPIFEALINGLRERFGSIGEAFLYYIGYEIGRKAFKNHYQMSISKTPGELVRINEVLFKAVGWGKLKILDYDSSKCFAIAVVEKSFECELAGRTNKPYSQFIRGALAGWFSELTGKSCGAEETKCIAKGDPYCEILIKPAVAPPTLFT